MEDSTNKPLSKTFGIPDSRKGSVKNNESEILLLKKKASELFSALENGSEVFFSAGFVTMFAGTTAPDSWLFCDGSAVQRSEYTDLFESIGVSYGSGDGSTTFNLPNLQQRFPKGASTPSSVGQTGGSETHGHTVTVVEADNSHTHEFEVNENGNTDNAGSHLHSVSVSSDGASSTTNNGFHNHSSTANTGGAANTGGPSQVFGRDFGNGNVASQLHTHSIPSHSHTMVNPSDGLHNHSVFNHTHGASSGTDGSHDHNLNVNYDGTTDTSSTLTHTHTAASSTEDNVPPFVTINYIIKT